MTKKASPRHHRDGRSVRTLARGKAARGDALARGCLEIPVCAQPPKLSPTLSLPAAAACVLRESFGQFTANLDALRTSRDPEVVHQARIGWRRFRCALRIFKPVLPVGDLPSWSALQSLLKVLSELRDLDVAWHETLPPLQQAFIAGDARRSKAWQAMNRTLQQAAARHRHAVRNSLGSPDVAAALMAITAWLEALSDARYDCAHTAKVSLRRWSKRRMARLHRQLRRARKARRNGEQQHRLRILAKHMRYGVEALRSVLPHARAKRWHQQACRLQIQLGAERDLSQVNALLTQLGWGGEIAAYLRSRSVDLGAAHSPII